jgi:hypothetical protein
VSVAVSSKRSNRIRGALRTAVWYPAPEGANAALAWTGLGLAIAAPAVVALPVGPLAKCLVLLAFASFGPGSALLCHVRLGAATAAWAMALVLSLSMSAMSASAMVWLGWWHPQWMLWGLSLLSIASAASCVAPILVGGGGRPAGGGGPATPDRTRGSAGSRPTVGPGPTVGPSPTVGPGPTGRPREAPGSRVGSRAPGSPAPDTTMVIPRFTDPPVDSTVVMARIREADDTMAIPRVRDRDATSVIPRIRDADETGIIDLPMAGRGADSTMLMARIPDSGDAAVAPDAGPSGATDRSTAARIAGIVVLLAGVACWVTSVLRSSTAGVGDYGLLSVMHPTFFVAVGLCVVGFLLEVRRDDRRGWLLVGYLVLMILILHATVPILVREPEYAWTYKHVGVIELFRTTGRIENPSDIYQAWPSVFATVAQLVTLSGASSLRVAAWGPVFFDAADCLPLFAIVRSLTNDRRLPYLTVFVFTCINWVAQDYLSPQAFTYVLCLGAVLILLRWLRGRPGYSTVRPRWLGRLWAWLHLGLVEVPYPSKRARRTALACLYVVYTAVVISHQLSPYMVALSASALVVLGLVRSWQVIPILLGIAVLYLLPNYNAVDQYGLFDGLNVFSTFLHSTQGVGPETTVNTAGRIFSVQAVQLLSVLVWGLAALAVLTSRARVGPVAAPATLAFAPFAVMFGQGYGGEAIYRVFLFSVPWCAYLIVTLLLRLRRIPRAAGMVGASLVLTAATLAGIQGAHGQLEFDQFSPADVRAMQYVFTHVPHGSTVLSASANLPSRLTANYGDFNGGADPESLTDVVPTLSGTVTAAQMADIDKYCAGFTDGPVYVVYMNSMVTYAHYFGYLPDGTLQSLNAALKGSPDWKLFYRSGDTIVYRFAAPPA